MHLNQIVRPMRQLITRGAGGGTLVPDGECLSIDTIVSFVLKKIANHSLFCFVVSSFNFRNKQIISEHVLNNYTR